MLDFLKFEIQKFKRLKYLLKYALYLYCLMELVFGGTLESLQNNELHLKFYSSKLCGSEHTFKFMKRTTLNACAEECIRRSRCQFISFHRLTHMCNMKESNASLTTGDGCVLVGRAEMTSWNLYGLGPCGGPNPPCGATQRCNTASSEPDGYVCEFSECEAPEDIWNATVMSSLCDIGMKNVYFCDNSFLGFGDNGVTCDLNATWSGTNFKCYPICEEPVVANATLTASTTFRYSFGTVVNFQCADGFYSFGDIVQECNDRGQWTETDDMGTCYRYCSDSSVNNADISTPPYGPYKNGTVANFTCQSSYYSTIDGGTLISKTCDVSGQWLGNGECAKSCALSSFGGVQMPQPTEKQRYTVGDRVTMNCPGLLQVRCTEEGSWETISGTCVTVTPPPPGR